MHKTDKKFTWEAVPLSPSATPYVRFAKGTPLKPGEYVGRPLCLSETAALHWKEWTVDDQDKENLAELAADGCSKVGDAPENRCMVFRKFRTTL